MTTHAEGGISSRLGNPLSSLQTGRPQHRHPISPSAIFSLELTDSAWLHTRIAQRFDAMLAAAQALMENKP